MSSWKEWQIAIKNGNEAQAEESRREYEEEMRREAERDAYIDAMREREEE